MDAFRRNLLLDASNIGAVINAALTVAADPQEHTVAERAKFITLLDELAERPPTDNANRETLRQCAIALVLGILMRGPSDIRLHYIKALTVEDARKRLDRALEIDAESAPLPRIVREMAYRLLHHFPVKEIEEEHDDGLEVTVIAKDTVWKKTSDSEFKAYKRLAKPVRLLRAPDAQAVETALHRDLPWMHAATDFVVRELQLSEYAGRRHFHLPPLLLVGEPGVAKTHFAKSLAEIVGAPFRAFSAAGSTDSMSLRGTSQGWSSARPSSLITTMLQHECASPIVLVDEIEKASSSRHNGNMLDTLLTMLDPVTPWFCEYLEVNVDLRYCSFVATANSLRGLSRPLLDRFQIIHVPRPEKEHFDGLIDSVLSRLAAELGLADPRLLPEFSVAERQGLVQSCENVRQLARAVRHRIQDKVAELRVRKPDFVH